MNKRAKHTSKTYNDIYDTLSKVKTLNFKPKSRRQYALDHETKKRVYVRTIKEFSPQQKATLARMALVKNISEKTGEIYYTKSHIYNLAKMVEAKEADFVKWKGSAKKKKAQKAFAKKSGFTVTDKGTFNTVQHAHDSKWSEIDDDFYILEYTYQTPIKAKGRGAQIDYVITRNEMFVPFPREILGWPEAIEDFIKDLQKTYKPADYRLAVNGHQGRTSFKPSEMFKYMWTLQAEDDDKTPLFEMKNPFINGVYLILKQRVTKPKNTPKIKRKD